MKIQHCLSVVQQFKATSRRLFKEKLSQRHPVFDGKARGEECWKGEDVADTSKADGRASKTKKRTV